MDYRTIALEKLAAKASIKAYNYQGAPLEIGAFGRSAPGTVQLSPESKAQAIGNLVADDITHLANQNWFQERAGDGVQGRGRVRIEDSLERIKDLPLVNELSPNTPAGTPSGATSYMEDRRSKPSYIAMPKDQIDTGGTYRGTTGPDDWAHGNTLHEGFHHFLRNIKGYEQKFQHGMDLFGVKPRNAAEAYYLNPKEQAAEVNTIRSMKGAFPDKAKGGIYTPEQADEILPSSNPYFRLLSPELKAWYLNHTKNKKPTAYKPQTTMVG